MDADRAVDGDGDGGYADDDGDGDLMLFGVLTMSQSILVNMIIGAYCIT